MSVEFYRESPGKFDSRTLSRETLNRWTGRSWTLCTRTSDPGRFAKGSAKLLEEDSLGGDERDVCRRADSSRQSLNCHRQVYSHVCLIPSKGRNIPI